MSSVIREELENALADHSESLNREITAVRTEMTNNTMAVRAEIDHVRADKSCRRGTVNVVG